MYITHMFNCKTQTVKGVRNRAASAKHKGKESPKHEKKEKIRKEGDLKRILLYHKGLHGVTSLWGKSMEGDQEPLQTEGDPGEGRWSTKETP